MVLGLAGTHGAGKGAVVQCLKEFGFMHCSAREIFLDILRARGVEPNRSTISAVANELREQYGVAYVVEEYLRRFDYTEHDLVIESIYTLGEVAAIRAHGGYVIAVDADPALRYERIKGRMSETDAVSKEDFLKKQQEELVSDDPAKQNMRAVMEDADFTVINDGTLEELRIQVGALMEKVREVEQE